MRNRIIEYFELAGSYESQLAYERDVPIAHVTYEVINQWEDCVPPAPGKPVDDLRVFSADELQAIQDFQPTWEATAAAVPDGYPPLSIVQALPAWDELRQQALKALAVFQRRGRLPDDEEAAG